MLLVSEVLGPAWGPYRFVSFYYFLAEFDRHIAALQTVMSHPNRPEDVAVYIGVSREPQWWPQCEAIATVLTEARLLNQQAWCSMEALGAPDLQGDRLGGGGVELQARSFSLKPTDGTTVYRSYPLPYTLLGLPATPFLTPWSRDGVGNGL